MRLSAILILFLITLANCQSQPDYSNDEKLKLNDNLFLVQQTDGYLAIDKDNNSLFPLPYDSVSTIGNVTFKHFKVKKNNKYGLIDFNAIELLFPAYEELVAIENKSSGETYLKMNSNGKWGVMIYPGNLMKLPFTYDEIGTFGESKRLLKVRQNGKYGFLDLGLGWQGGRTTGLIYDELENYKKGGAKFKKDGRTGKVAISNSTGFLIEIFDNEKIDNSGVKKQLIPTSKRFTDNKNYSVDNKYGLKDKKTNQVIVPLKYQTLIEKPGEKSVIYIAEKNDLWGAIDKNDKVIIPIKYKEFWSPINEKQIDAYNDYPHCNSAFRFINKNDKHGLIANDGAVLIPFEYDRIDYSRHHHFLVNKNDKWGIYNSQTKTLSLPIEYDEVKLTSSINKNNYIVKKDNQFGIIDMDGNILVEPMYERLVFKDQVFYSYNEQGDSLYRAMDENGVLVSIKSKRPVRMRNPAVYTKEEVYYDSDGKYNSKYTYIDNLGNPIEVLNKQRSGAMYSNLIEFYEEEKTGIVNRHTGEIIIEPIFQDFEFMPPFVDKIMAKQNDKWGIIDLSGKFVVPNLYDKLSIFNDVRSGTHLQFSPKKYRFQVTIGDKAGIINLKGETLVEIKYGNSFLTFMNDHLEEYVTVVKDGKRGLCKYGLLQEPKAYYENIYTAAGTFYVVQNGKKLKAKIVNQVDIEILK